MIELPLQLMGVVKALPDIGLGRVDASADGLGSHPLQGNSSGARLTVVGCVHHLPEDEKIQNLLKYQSRP